MKIKRISMKLLIFLIGLTMMLSCGVPMGFCRADRGGIALCEVASWDLKQEFPQTKATVRDDNEAQFRLEREVRRLAALAGGKVGVSALHVESGQRFSLNGTERFPLASAYKVPIAVQLLMRVDRGEVALDQRVTLRSCDIHPGSGKLIKTFKKPESYSVRELLELMLLVSDNSASDAVLKLAGGPKAVTESMQALGIKGMEISRSTLDMLADWRGIDDLSGGADFTVAKYNRLRDKVPTAALEAAQKRFYFDARDSATPETMTSLMALVCNGSALKPETTTVLLNIMARCQTGKSRIKKLIPPGMKVANKTGTIGNGIVNDVALLTLPDDAGHVAISVFIKASERDVAQQEQVMAHIARYCYDYYLFRGAVQASPSDTGSCQLRDPNCYP